MIQQVLARVEGGDRADSALQKTFRSEHGVAASARREVSETVYAYFRWHGWLEEKESLTRRLAKVQELAGRFEAAPETFSDEELLEKALPQWVWDFMERDAGLVRVMQARPKLWVRARPGKAEELARALGEATIHGKVADAVEYHGEEDLYSSEEFKRGHFEIQDLSSQIVGLLCTPREKETWWDACAGEGGKTLHICDLLQNRGLVWASDRAEWRLKILQKRAARAGLFNYRTKLWVSTEKPAVKGPFDGVLVDAPCSGIGTWGRNLQARWSTSPKDVIELAEIQKKLLDVAAKTVKPGGRLLYSVCTLARNETIEVAEHFEKGHAEFEPLDLRNPLTDEVGAMLQLSPRHGGIGMFVAGWKGAVA